LFDFLEATNKKPASRRVHSSNLLYTGVTRGKRLVVLVGQKKAVAIAVRNASGRRRWSKLTEWLRPYSPVSRRTGVRG
jgi:ATP-dependent exoDNAse (exonuclease V) alpha subunit